MLYGGDLNQPGICVLLRYWSEHETQQIFLAEGRRKGCLSCDRLFVSEVLLCGSGHRMTYITCLRGEPWSDCRVERSQQVARGCTDRGLCEKHTVQGLRMWLPPQAATSYPSCAAAE